MIRQHIFDLLNPAVDFQIEYNNLITLLNKKDRYNNTIKNCIEYHFLKWKYRGTRYLDFAGVLAEIEKNQPYEKFLLLSEIMYNMLNAHTDHIREDNYDLKGIVTENEVLGTYLISIFQNIHAILEVINHYVKEIDNKSLILEKNSAAIAVAEITNDLQVLEYNHYALKGNLHKKGAILTNMFRRFESIRDKLTKCGFKSSCQDYAMLSNKLIRHNQESDKKLDEYLKTAGLEKEEQLYDITYDLYLSLILSYKYLENKPTIDDFKNQISK